MKIKQRFKDEKKEVSDIFSMIKNRKFEGYTGLAVKNSTYQFLTAAISKGGSLIFTIIIARMLLPELFGLYSLALSTIILFASLSDFGIGQAIIRYVSKVLEKRNIGKAKAYVNYLAKIKIIFMIISSLLLIILARFISDSYYHKSISLALMAGSLYIIFSGLISIAESVLFASNKFRYPMYKEILFQILRLTLVPLAIILTISSSLPQETLLGIILALAASYFIALIFIWVLMRNKVEFIHEKTKELTKKEKKNLLLFILPLSATVLSGVFFGYIDIVMLGRYVLAEHIGYYRAAFSLIGGLIPLLGFSAALLPLFSRLKGKRLERGFSKSAKIINLLSIGALIGTLIFSELAVKIIFGNEYIPAINLLRILSILLLCMPISSLYESYFISQGKTKILAKLLIISTSMNIILNFILIKWLVLYGHYFAVIGACIATIISRYFYLFALIGYRKKI